MRMRVTLSLLPTGIQMYWSMQYTIEHTNLERGMNRLCIIESPVSYFEQEGKWKRSAEFECKEELAHQRFKLMQDAR